MGQRGRGAFRKGQRRRILAKAYRLQDGLLEDVQTPGLQGDADGLLVLVVAQATQEHLVDDALQAGVDAAALLALLQLRVLHPLLGVVVDAFRCRGKPAIFNTRFLTEALPNS